MPRVPWLDNLNEDIHVTSTGSVSVRVQIQDVYLHPDIEFWTWPTADGNHTNNFGYFGHFVSAQKRPFRTVVHNLFRPGATNRFRKPFGGQTSVTSLFPMNA